MISIIYYLISSSPRDPGEDLLLDPEYPVPVAGALEVLPEAPLVRAGDEADAARRAGGDLRGLQELILLARNSIEGTYLYEPNAVCWPIIPRDCPFF